MLPDLNFVVPAIFVNPLINSPMFSSVAHTGTPGRPNLAKGVSRASTPKDYTRKLLEACTLLQHRSKLAKVLVEVPNACHSCEVFLPILAEVFEAKLFATTWSSTSKHWTPINLYEPITYAIGAADTRLFLSCTLYENEEWLRVSVDRIMNTIDLAEKTLKSAHALRPLKRQLLKSESKQVLAEISRARNLLEIDIANHEINNFLAYGSDASVEKPALLSSMSVMGEVYREVNAEETKQQARQLALSMVSIHTASLTVCRTLHYLARRPMLVIGLREEARMVMSQNTTLWSECTLASLEQLDAVLREVRGVTVEEDIDTRRREPQSFHGMDLIMDGEGDGLPYFAILQIKVLVLMAILRFDMELTTVDGGYRTARNSDDPAREVLLLRRYKERADLLFGDEGWSS